MATTRFQAVIFDMDGLLLDSEAIAFAAFRETCEHFAVGDQSHVFMQCIGTNAELGDRVLEEGLRGKADPLAFGRRWEENYLRATTDAPIPLKPGVTELLDALQAARVPLAVATSTGSPRARQKLHDAGILTAFQAVVGGDQVARSKPHPDIYLEAARELGVTPGHCLALEDSENGVRAALGAGMTVIQIPDLVEPSPEFRRLGHAVLESLHDVYDHVFGNRSFTGGGAT